MPGPHPKSGIQNPDTAASLLAAAVFAVIWVVYSLSPNLTSFDSRWVVLIARSILHDGDIDLREHLPLIEQNDFYAVECVGPDYQRTLPVRHRSECEGAKIYCYYPVAVPVLTAPLLFAVEQGLRLGRPIAAALAPRVRPSLRPLLERGDIVGARGVIELAAASFFVALAAAVMFRIARRSLSIPRALAVTGLFAFGTAAWSTASRGLWQHGPSILFLAIALYLLVLAAERPSRAAWAGLPVAIAFTIRPTNAVSVLVLTIYVFVHYRRHFLRYLLWAAPVAAAFFAFSYSHYGYWMAPYFFARGSPAGSLELHGRFFEALAGNLISPSRGLLTFSPVFLALGLAGPGRASNGDAPPLRRYLWTIAGIHWVLISTFPDWGGGHSIGPRYFSDMTPYLVFLLMPVFEAGRARWLAVLVALLALPSCWIHYRSATRWSVYEWNIVPVGITEHQERLWDWRDPPFLR